MKADTTRMAALPDRVEYVEDETPVEFERSVIAQLRGQAGLHAAFDRGLDEQEYGCGAG
jgi:hypothetical protein